MRENLYKLLRKRISYALALVQHAQIFHQVLIRWKYFKYFVIAPLAITI